MNQGLGKRFVWIILLVAAMTSWTISQEAGAQSISYKLTKCARWDNNLIDSFPDQTFNDLCGWTSASGKEYAILGSIDSIYFIDVTDPYHPVLRDAMAGKAKRCVHRDFRTASHYCYAVADEGKSSLQVFDLQYLPDSVHKVYDSDSLFSQAHDIFIEEPWLYVAWPKTKSGNPEALFVLDITNPEKPVFVSSLIPPKTGPGYAFSEVHDLLVKNDTAFLCNGYNGMFIYDYRNHLGPKLISSLTRYPDKGFNHSCTLSKEGNQIFFTDEDHSMKIKSYNISKVRDPMNKDHELDFDTAFGRNFSLGSVAHDPYVRGDLLFVSYYQDGLVVYDVSRPTKPVFIDAFDTYPQNSPTSYSGFQGCWGAWPYLQSGTILAADQCNGLFVFRIDTMTGINSTHPLSAIRAGIYPNPATDAIHLKLISSQPEKYSLGLYDMNGRMILQEEYQSQPGIENIILTKSIMLHPGQYILKIMTQNSCASFAVIKQ